MGWRDDVAALPSLAPSTFELDPARTALIVIDMQYVDAHRDYGLGASLKESHPDVWHYYFDRVEELVIPNSQRLLTEFRRRAMRIVHLTIGPVLADGADMVGIRRPDRAPGLTPMLHNVGTKEHEILPDVAPTDGELVINKTSRGAFNSTGIDQVLRNFDVSGLVIAGVSTSSCVETTARDAADRGYRTVIVEDATAELDEASHEATLRQWAMRWGRVWTTDETISALGRA